jgi:hypothetical protein
MSSPDPLPQQGLSQSERDFLRGRVPYEQRVERRRPGWLVAGLVWATLGLYVFFWVGLNWAEMKRERKDDRMYPIWHALAMLVPIYSYFRFHANFRVLNELLETTRSPHRVRPVVAVITFLLASLLISVPVDDLLLTFINVAAALGAISWVIHHGQSGMNAYWDARPERKTTSTVKLWERLLLGAGGGLWFLLLVGVVAETLA